MAGAVNMDQYEAYFRRADLDGDGRISGSEAVTFFQGSNLAKHVLSQIWTYADQSKSGFLGRVEFYNALRLVTVAQSKRELTPDIVKAALYGPAAAKIPAPQINIPTTALPTLGSTPQMGMPTPLSSQIYGFRPQGFPNPDAAQQNFPALQNQMMRPAQLTTSSSAPRPPQGVAGPEISRISSSGGLNVANTNVASDWLSGGTSMAPPGPRGIVPSVASAASIPQTPVLALSQSTGADSKALVPSGNGLPANSGFATELFSATTSIPKQEPAGMNFPASTPTSSARVPVSSGSITKQNGLDSMLLEPANSQIQRTPSLSSLLPTSGQTIPGSTSTSSVIVPVSSGNQTSPKLNALDSLSAFSLQPISGQFQPTQKQSLLTPGQHVPATAASNDSHSTWPKMKPSDIQKYANVFMKVDTDRDGKITGEQARNLFLSWRLPREVLKQVWDLSDQDNDGMLSLREFSFALYLMEQYKEGRPLPPALPNNVLFDETLLSMTGQPRTVYASPASGFSQQQMMTGAQSMPPAAGQRPPFQGVSPGPDSKLQPNQQKPVALVLEDSFLMDNGVGNTRNSEGQAPRTAEKKVQETENMILDSKEKIEFYRTKMQELVLYKSRCDNRLNEITERASADKREAESLAKKYEEKYKQVAEIASKLTIEEAKFRDIQERKMEFQQAITKMEQGGSADGIMQVRVDRIQSDLDTLMRALKERCSKHGINVKSTTVIELPTGWQPGAPEVTAEWDEDWDKFEDEGFLNDLAIEGKKATPVQREENFTDNDSIHDSSPKAYLNKGELLSNGDHVSKSESVFNHSDDGFGRSPQDSPVGRSAFDSPVGRDAFDSPVGKAAFDSPDNPFRKGPGTDAETHRSFDESTWGAFDNNDDGDSVWGYNKDSDIEKPKDLFGTDDFRVNVVRTESPHGSPHGDSMFKAKSPFKFEDSVPGTPLSRFGNSPRYSEAGDHFFDNMSSFDPFSMHDDSFAVGPERLTRFDSINSSKDFGFSQDKFSRFDSISSSKDLGFGQDKFSRFDSISSTSDYGFGQDKFSRFDSVSNSRDFGYSNDKFSRSDSIGSSKDFGYNSEKFTRFDSMSSTRDDGHGHAFSFDEPDPFGSSGPFKVSDNQTPKKNSDNWKAF